MDMKKGTIIVFTAKIARELLHDGYTLVDIKPDKKDPDGKRSIFVFKIENGLLDKIREYKEENLKVSDGTSRCKRVAITKSFTNQ